MEKCFSLEEIKVAVDIAIGDDGFRSKEVCAILETFWKEREEETEHKIQDEQAKAYEEKRINGFL
jgi:uncharacterized protein YdaU (DUF1376 family)